MLTITQITRTKVDREGNPLTTRDGRNYERVLLKATEKGDRWISGFGSSDNEGWAVGSVIDVGVEEVNKDGTTYLNFKKANPNDLIMREIENIKDRLTELESMPGTQESAKKSDSPPAEDEIKVDNIPF